VPLAPGEVALPTTAHVTTPPGLCAGVGLDTVLHGDPHDPDVAWLEDRTSSSPTRIKAVWPTGYRARFTPKLEIRNPTDKIVLIEGSAVMMRATSSTIGP
jgi:hypothetical protein